VYCEEIISLEAYNIHTHQLTGKAYFARAQPSTQMWMVFMGVNESHFTKVVLIVNH